MQCNQAVLFSVEKRSGYDVYFSYKIRMRNNDIAIKHNSKDDNEMLYYHISNDDNILLVNRAY